MNNFSILIVDDSLEDRYILKRDLKKKFKDSLFFEADNGKTALDFLNNFEENEKKYKDKFPPLIIFLDINMPVIDGFQFLKRFKEYRATKSEFQCCILMMLTSSSEEEDKRKAFSYDFVKDYIIKGHYSIEELSSKIQTIIQ